MTDAKRMLFAFVTTTVSVGLLASSVVASEVWTIEEKAAKCILENLESYRALNNRIIIISVQDCPNTDLFATAMTGKKNAGGLTANIKTRRKADEFDRFISYPKDVFDCLDATKVIFQKGKALFPKVPNCAQ